MAEMKWWGWGAEGMEFTDADKPELGPFIQAKLRLDVRRVTAPVPGFASLRVPDSILPAVAAQRVGSGAGSGHVSTDALTESCTVAASRCGI